MSRVTGLETFKNDGVKYITTQFVHKLYRSKRFPIASPRDGFRFGFNQMFNAFQPGILCFMTFEFSNGKTTSEPFTLKFEGEDRPEGQYFVAYYKNDLKVAECEVGTPACKPLMIKYHADGVIRGDPPPPGGHSQHDLPLLSEAETFQQFHKIMWIKLTFIQRAKYSLQLANDVFLLDYPPPTTTTEAPPPTTTRRPSTAAATKPPKKSAVWGIYVLIASLILVAFFLTGCIVYLVVRFMLKRKKQQGLPGAPAPVKKSASGAPSGSKTASRQPIVKTEELLPPSSSAAPSPASIKAKPEGSTVDEYVPI
uniref:Uncharacterized protein n=1 Tax=Panagrellus redivivus TaxID=6233 RepID=A0A7E4W5C0_PANRE